MPLKFSYKPVACGFHVRLMSPLGSYPDRSIILQDAALIIGTDLCYSIVRIVKEDWGFSEVDFLSPLDIPLFGSLLLSRAGRPYPFSGVTLEAEKQEPLSASCISECREHLLANLEQADKQEHKSLVVHWPPVSGGYQYELWHYGDVGGAVQQHLSLLTNADPLLLRGIGSLIKAQMAWHHGEFTDAACMFLWIALDAAHSLTLRKLRESGMNNPSSQDASRHFDEVVGYETPWDKFFEEDYENRIRVFHPDNRFGAEARPQLLADDFLELNDILIPYFDYLVTGVFFDPSMAE
jgi:hypothetical protein